MFFSKKSTYNTVRLIFVICVMLYAILRQNITALQPYLVRDEINVVLMVGALLLLVWDLLLFRNVFKMEHICWLIAFFGVSILSSIINVRYGIVDNLKSMVIMSMQFFILYVACEKDEQSLTREFKIIANVLCAVWTLAAFVSVCMYFTDTYYQQWRYLWGDPVLIDQGFVRTQGGATIMRLWGVFVDPNFAASISVAVICVSFYLIFSSAKKRCWVIYGLCAFIQFLYVVLSNSRMGHIILCMACAVGGWFFFGRITKKVTNNRFIRECISILIACVVMFVGYGAVQTTQNVLPYIKYSVNQLYVQDEDVLAKDVETTVNEATEHELVESTVTESEVDETEHAERSEDIGTRTPTQIYNSTDDISANVEETNEIVSTEEIEESKMQLIESLERQDVQVKSDKSNGRFELWKDGMQIFKAHPILGVGPRNYHTAGLEVVPESSIAAGAYSIHNSFIELLMGNGVIGFVLMVIFFAMCAKDVLVIRYTDRKMVAEVFLMIAVLCLLACGVFIACLFYTLSGATVILFLILGYAIRLISIEKRAE